MRSSQPERHCCDGQCLQGRPCPSFAPGVIQGPHWRRRRPGVLRPLRAVGQLLATAVVMLLGTWAWGWMVGWR